MSGKEYQKPDSNEIDELDENEGDELDELNEIAGISDSGRFSLSGLYVASWFHNPSNPGRWSSKETLRLDVDGRYPQMTASGTIHQYFFKRLHWVAKLFPNRGLGWSGTIWYKNGSSWILPETRITILPNSFPWERSQNIKVTFSGEGSSRIQTFTFKSPYFYPVEFEFDSVEGTNATTQIKTHGHPNRPATLPKEALTIETVYKRAGFDVSNTLRGSVSLDDAGTNGLWSDSEMHDAMQAYWSRFDNKSQWSLWVLFAAQHDRGYGLGGKMFDSIGPNHRQGTAIFNDSFISQAPARDHRPNAWTARMRFWTAIHEMGHAFNLAHSWQKELGTPWITLANEPEVRSFMNYPFRVAGGQAKFFADFEYRFSDAELLFMRHAPERFVQMGNADWFDNHGFEKPEPYAQPSFKLALKTNRKDAVYQFLEPVVIEIKLTNISGQPQMVDENLLAATDHMTVILKKEGKPARQWVPFSRECWEPQNSVLNAGRSKYDSLFVGAGQNGWDLAEPGRYTLQMGFEVNGEYVVSLPMALKIVAPQSHEEERLAQDYFSDDVGRILNFDGSQFLTSGNDTLRNLVDRFGDHPAALHAGVALGNPLAKNYKLLALDAVADAAQPPSKKITLCKAKEEDAKSGLTKALLENPQAAAETLGHVDFKYYVDLFSEWLLQQGDDEGAAKGQKAMTDTLSDRQVPKWVFEE